MLICLEVNLYYILTKTTVPLPQKMSKLKKIQKKDMYKEWLRKAFLYLRIKQPNDKYMYDKNERFLDTLISKHNLYL